MALYLIQFCLPVLLGYTLFVGLAGRLNPFVKPEYTEERPSWFLGVWIGIAVTLVLGAGLSMAYSASSSIEGAAALWPSAAFFLCVLLLPGFAGYSLYRRHITHELRRAAQEKEQSSDLIQRVATSGMRQNDEKLPPAKADDLATAKMDELTAVKPSMDDLPDNEKIQNNAPVIATFLKTADIHVLDTHNRAAANSSPQAPFEPHLDSNSDLANEADINDVMDDTVFEGFHYSELDLDALDLDATQLLDVSDICDYAATENDHTVPSELELFDIDSDMPISAFSDEELDITLYADYTSDYEALWLHSEFVTDEIASDSLTTSMTQDRDAALTVDQASAMLQQNPNIVEVDEEALTSRMLEQRLAEELSAHEETSRQLRITRKVLARLTPSAQESLPTSKVAQKNSDTVLSLKGKLAESLSLQAAQQAKSNTEMKKRLQAEKTSQQLRQELINAKHEIRRSTAARAKALGTANKAIAFARQTLQVRSLLEDELALARSTLAKRQETISSIIKELELEKDRTQEKLAHMAQQLIAQDKQLQCSNADGANDGSVARRAAGMMSNGKLTTAHQISPDL